jgi:hypothetical protein
MAEMKWVNIRKAVGMFYALAGCLTFSSLPATSMGALSGFLLLSVSGMKPPSTKATKKPKPPSHEPLQDGGSLQYT